MTGIPIAPVAEAIVIGLACLSLLLLILAGWLGRWPLWVAGWTVALVALVIVFLFREPAPGSESDPDEEETLIGIVRVEERTVEGGRP